MKILMCDNRLGGLLGFRAEVIRHFVEQGHDVSIVAPKAVTDWDKVGTRMLLGVNYIEVALEPSGQSVWKDVKLFRQYKEIFKRERPDIVFNYTIKPNIYSSIAAHQCGSRVICMLAGLGYMFNGDALTKRLGRYLYKKGLDCAEKVMVLNQSNYDYVVQHLVNKERLILLQGGEGVDLDKYAYQPADYSKSIRFMMIARLLYDKGYSEFVQAARIVKSTHPNVKFELLGPIDQSSPMGVPTEQVEQDVYKGYIQYLGVRNDSIELLSRKDVVMVLPSKYGEGLNRSLMEACSIGRPIITTKIPGCCETVEDGRNGYLIPHSNPSALARAILRFLELSDEEKVQMGNESRKIAEEKFDIKNVIDIYDKLLRDVMKSGLRSGFD